MTKIAHKLFPGKYNKLAILVEEPRKTQPGFFGVPIFYQPDLPEKELRVRLAHELGHLFLLAVKEQHKADKRLPVYEGTTEPLSSVFGIFTISDKNHFYANVRESDRNHQNWDSILSDFLALSR